MTDRRRLLLAGTLGAAALGYACLGGSTGAVAAAPDAVGYWWAQQTGTGPALPAPASVPAGGLWVAYQGPQQTQQGQTAGGNEAVSALRVAAQPGATITLLTLHVHQPAGATPAAPATPPPAPASAPPPALVACPTTSPWTPVQAGAWSQAPVATCRPFQVAGLLSADGSAYSFNTATLLDATGSLDVVIEPDPTTTAPFSLSFDPPDQSSITLATNGDSGSAAAPPPFALASPAAGAPQASVVLPPAVALPPALPVAPISSTPPAAAPAPAPAPQTRLPVATRPVATVVGPRQPLLLVVLLLAPAAWVARYMWMARAAVGRTLVPLGGSGPLPGAAAWQGSRSLLGVASSPPREGG